MVQGDPNKPISGVTTVEPTTHNGTYPGKDHDRNYNPKEDYGSYPSDTVAAVTIAVLAVIVIITMLIVFRALRKRQRARRGERFGDNVIPTVTTGVMGTGGAAYANSNLQGVPMRGPVRWESINPASGAESSSSPDQASGVR